MRKCFIWFCLSFCLTAQAQTQTTTQAQAVQAGDVVVSIKPLHSLVQSVMGDTGEAVLLIDGTLHSAVLKPSQAAALSAAKIIFYIGGGLEPFLPIDTSARQVALSEGDGVKLLPLSGGGEHDEHEDDEHHDGKMDLHIWLDIDNAKVLANDIAEELSTLFPQHRAIYTANAAALMLRLDALDDELRQTLLAVRGRPYIVFHDAYQYFERRYGIKAAGVIAAAPGVPLSARRLQNIFSKIDEVSAKCVFREPQFSARQVEAIARNSDIRIGILDPLGGGLGASEKMYFQLMRGLGQALVDCLL